MAVGITRDERSRPLGRGGGVTSTTDLVIAVPSKNVRQVKVWVDVLSYVAVNGVAGATVPSATNTGYVEATTQEIYQIEPSIDSYVHVATTTGAGNCRVTFYG